WARWTLFNFLRGAIAPPRICRNNVMTNLPHWWQNGVIYQASHQAMVLGCRMRRKRLIRPTR
ncbi:hypothetical protein E2K69_16895, partial [Escherichia coli]